jgi:hypothetical protein
MNGLEQAFYIIGIVFMSLMLLLFIGLVVAVFVIKAKINRIHDNIEHKIDLATNLASKGGELASMASKAVIKKTKKAAKKR